MTWLLVDADMLLYQAVCSCETEIEWMSDIITTHLPVREVMMMFDDLLNVKKKQADTIDVTLCWTGDDNFRKKVDPSYKINRRAGNHRVKPVGFKESRRRIENNYKSETWYRLEADDVIGILATRHVDATPIIWSGDKDLQQIPGFHLNREGDIELITEDQADAYFYQQCLSGDAVDGFGGCPGVGPKTAKKLIPVERFNSASAWRTVVKQYEKKGLSEEYALTQARLARILRDTEYIYDDINLWTPPTLLTTVTTKP
jgi:DNA polymerase-1